MLLAQDSPDVSENTPEVFVVFCGLVGLGKLISQGERHWHTTLREPALLKQPDTVQAVLILLDAITASLAAAGDAKTDPYKSLRQTLGYGWSVAAAADFNQGRLYIERWCQHSDPNIRWVMRENLGKKRLQRADPQWTAVMLALLTTA